MKTKLLALLACLLCALPALAATTYTYDGPNFTGRTEHLRVTFTTNAPLQPSTSYMNATDAGVISSSISVVGPSGTLIAFSFPVTPAWLQLHTDGAGKIDAWYIWGEKKDYTGASPTMSGPYWQAYTMNTMAFIPGTGVPGVNQSSLVTGHYNHEQATQTTFYPSCTGAPTGCTLAGNGQPYTSNYSGIISPSNTNGSWWVVSNAPSPLVVNGALPAGTVGSPYNGALAATGGVPPYTWTASSLPSGLTVDVNGVLSGMPDTAGSFNLQATVTDSTGATGTGVVNLTINPPAVTACSGTNAVITAYVPRSPGYIVINGGANLLDHLWTTNLNPTNTTFLGGLVNWYQTGLIVDYNGVTDPAGCVLTNLTVKPKVAIATAALPNGTAGMAYSAPLSVTWGVAPYALSVNGLPAGLSFDGANIIGVPTTIGTFTVAVSATDAVGALATKNLSLTVVDPPLSFAPVLPNGTVGIAYSATFAATGGYGTFSYLASGLPAGLTLSGNRIAGTPTAAGTFPVTLTATDGVGGAQTVSTTLLVNPAPVGNFTVPDESKGKITALGADYLMVGTKKLIWNASTRITVNTPNGERQQIDSFVKVGIKVQWKGLRNSATNTVLTSQLEVN